MNKIKVLVVGSHPKVKGGISSVISQINSFEWDKNNVQIHFVPSYIQTSTAKMMLYYMCACIKIILEILTFKPDVVHVHMSYKGSFQRKNGIHKILKFFGKKEIVHLHGSEFKKWYDSVDTKKQNQIRRFLREINTLIVLGDVWEKTILEIEPKTNVVVLQNAIEIPQEKETAKWNEKAFQILYLGVLIERKGVADLIEALNSIKEQARKSNVKVIITGSGDQEENLKSDCLKYGLDDIIEFRGWTAGDDKKKLLKESQLLVLPSYNEGLPVAILEAISYGLPVVATDVGDVRSAVIDNENGYLIKPKDVDKLAKSLSLSFSDKEKWHDMSKKSRAIAEEKFNQVEYFEKLLDLYKK